jgi:hypothetical protein
MKSETEDPVSFLEAIFLLGKNKKTQKEKHPFPSLVWPAFGSSCKRTIDLSCTDNAQPGQDSQQAEDNRECERPWVLTALEPFTLALSFDEII